MEDGRQERAAAPPRKLRRGREEAEEDGGFKEMSAAKKLGSVPDPDAEGQGIQMKANRVRVWDTYDSG